jgi:hypothetical protein
MTSAITGGCLCGAVRFAYRGTLQPGGYCHCADCRRITGGPFYVGMRMAAADFRLTQGEPRGYTKVGHSGQPLTRHFCGDCGAPLYTTSPRHPDALYVKAGALDDPSLVRPAYQIWTASRVPWAAIPDDLPAYPGNRT